MAERPKIGAFREWLISEVTADGAGMWALDIPAPVELSTAVGSVDGNLQNEFERRTRTGGHVRMTVTFQPCEAVIGAEVIGVSLVQAPNAAVVSTIEERLEKYGVLIFRNQDITPEQHVGFSKAFGPLAAPKIKASSPDQVARIPDAILAVGNTGDSLVTFSPASPDGELEWHSDHIQRQVPARASLLFARLIPAHGGDTLFACMYSAYDGLSAGQKSEYEGLEVVNSVMGVEAWLEAEGHVRKSNKRQQETSDYAIHPLVRAHPVTGRKALYFGNQVSVGVVGWEKEKSLAFFKKLTAHACSSTFQYRHKWRVGDAVLWDNRRVLHAGTAYDMNEQRLLHRTTFRETEPVKSHVYQ
jgi:alpha-ketoglutarate-dependent taurine dioxygenase